MSAIPPPSLISFIQSSQAQRAQSARADQESNQAPAASRELVRQSERLTDSVDNADAQSTVNTEDGGHGSTGRWADDSDNGEHPGESNSSEQPASTPAQGVNIVA